MTHHELLPAPGTIHWGHFDAALAPVLEVDSGDTLTLHSLSGGPEDLPPAGSDLYPAPEYAAVHAAMLGWLAEADFAAVRDWEKLPADRREAWGALWAGVRKLRDDTAPAK